MKNILTILLIASGIFLVGACSSNKNASDDSPKASYPEKDDLPPQSLLVELKFQSQTKSTNGYIYKAEIIRVIRYGMQAPIISKGSTISILCSGNCAKNPPENNLKTTTIIISNQNIMMDNSTNQVSWEVYSPNKL